jgi:radical SAM protein with 4Fe4S-binding SPASM domain
MEETGIMDIGISLHAARKGLHDALTGISGSYDKALSSIRLLKQKGFNVVIKHSVSNRNFGEYEFLQKIALQEGCILECDSLIIPRSYTTVSPFALSQKQQCKFLVDMDIKQNYTKRKPLINENMHCDAGRSICGITPYGSVLPCILLPVEFGTLVQKSLADIWNGNSGQCFRNREKVIDTVCETCAINTMCSRCHAIAYMESGKWNSKSKSLCNRAIALSKVVYVEKN